MTARRLRSRGFTILEILIAIVVLVLGIMGIIALFPTAIESGNRTVEDSYAAAITQSVVDAITVGLRESRYTHDTAQGTYTYFIFNHDGVLDQSPRSAGDFTRTTPPSGAGAEYVEPGYLWARDFCVILPRGPTPNNLLPREPVFLYPVPCTPTDAAAEPPTGDRLQRNTGALGAASLDLLDNLRDAAGYGMRTTVDGNRTVLIRRVYPLGRYRMPEGGPGTLPDRPTGGGKMAKGDVRLEFRGDVIVTNASGTSSEESIAADPYPTYSFAFALQRARVDSNGDGRVDQVDQFSDTLYQLRVMIFKNFDAAAANDSTLTNPGDPAAIGIPRSNVPIKEFVTLLAL